MRRKNITELREWHLRVPGEALSVPVNCSRIGDVFRIESIPLCYDVISYGDIFEADQKGNELVLRRIVKRANGERTHSCSPKQFANRANSLIPSRLSNPSTDFGSASPSVYCLSACRPSLRMTRLRP